MTSHSDDPLMTFKRWQIGDITVTRIQESDTITLDPAWLLKTMQADVAKHEWMQPHFATPEGMLKVNIQAFVIEAGGTRILVDPCIGNDKVRESPLFNMLANPFLDRLEAAGFPAESIDVVLCTHLHVDHCGWNTRLVDGKWVPTFVNAKYLFARLEYEYARVDKGLEQEATYLDSVKPIVDAGLAEIVEFDHRIVEGVRLEPSPGHTPGHCWIVISSRGREAVITGDSMHHPVQACQPDICSTFDWSEDQAITTRKALLDRCAGHDVIVFGTHFAEPTGVRVLSDGQAWRMEGV